MSLELSEEALDDLSPQLRQVIINMQSVNKLLTQYESSNENVFMKQAASKIKEDAPAIRALVASATDEEKAIAKQAMGDMKRLVQRAKDLKNAREVENRQTSEYRRQIQENLTRRKSQMSSMTLVPAPSSMDILDKSELSLTMNPSEAENARKKEFKAKRLREIKERKRLLEKEAAELARITRQKQIQERLERQKQMELEKAEIEQEEKDEVHSRMEAIAQHEEEEKFKTASTTKKEKKAANFKKGKDIWSKVIQDKEEAAQRIKASDPEVSSSLAEDYTILFIGDKGSGKTTIVNKFLEKSEAIVPSSVMEYSYGKRTKKNNNEARDVVHCWELGNITIVNTLQLQAMLEVTVTPQFVSSMAIVFVVDLSKLDRQLELLSNAFEVTRKRVDDAIKELRVQDDLEKLENLKKRANLFIPENHPDKGAIRPLGIPAIILGTKYDIFQNFEVHERKMVVKTLRYIAHINNASLVFTSKDDESLVSKFKSVLNFSLFNGRLNKAAFTDYSKPVLIPAGMDQLQHIGTINTGKVSSSQSIGLRAWKDAWAEYFPLPEEAESSYDWSRYLEEAIDLARDGKEKEFEKYQRESALKARATGNISASPMAQYERSIAKRNV